MNTKNLFCSGVLGCSCALTPVSHASEQSTSIEEFRSYVQTSVNEALCQKSFVGDIENAHETNYLYVAPKSDNRLYITLCKEGEAVFESLASGGKSFCNKKGHCTGEHTPEGTFRITQKKKAHTSNLYHVNMPYFMRLNESAIAIHAGKVTGYPASHGCIRLPFEKAKQLYSLVPSGTLIVVENTRPETYPLNPPHVSENN